jgi:hypothetical protein
LAEFVFDDAAARGFDGFGLQLGDVGFGSFAGGQQAVPLGHLKAFETLLGHGGYVG